MTQSDFNHLLSSIKALSPDQMRRLARELQTRLATPGERPASVKSAADAEGTAYDLASRAGLIGCIKGAPSSPTDLATNPKHMEGFGGD
jgi:plasmid stabilization system protein ParE